MAYYLSESAIRKSIRHLCRYGDTDVFPHLAELAFFMDEAKSIVAELKQLDLDNYSPGGAFEALAPKGKLSFRIVHQIPAIDTLLLLASVIEIGPRIEENRPALSTIQDFSYRYDINPSGDLFVGGRTFKDWLNSQQIFMQNNLKIKSVLITDISDFYARVNFHRLENLLDEVAPNHGAAKYIKKHIKKIRAKQSFGLPVGGSASRLLAELALADTDSALLDRGLIATRFVDDFRVFLRIDQDPYEALAVLAEQLSINEGLSLNGAKTELIGRQLYIRRLKAMTAGVLEEAESQALDELTANLYFDDEPDEQDLDKLKALNLLGMLNEEMSKENVDTGRVKVIFRALKITTPEAAVDFITQNFNELITFAKDLSLLMQALASNYPQAFKPLTKDIVDAILRPPASSIQLIRTWLLELLVRGVVSLTPSQLGVFSTLTSSSDRRQLLIVRGRCGDKNFFRRQKTNLEGFSTFELPCLVIGASCLPKDEYSSWLAGIKTSFTQPAGGLFLKWAELNRGKLFAKLNSTFEDHPE